MKFNTNIILLMVAIFALVKAEQPEEANEINCDEICAAQVAEATRETNQKMAQLQGELSPLKAALEQAKEASVAAAAEVTSLKGQLSSMESVVASAKAEADAIDARAAAKEKSITAQLTEMEAQVEAAKEKVAEYENMSLFINKEKLKLDVFGMFEKLGLVKSKEDETDL